MHTKFHAIATVVIALAPIGTDINLTYSLGGFVKDGFDELSKAADEVLGTQM